MSKNFRIPRIFPLMCLFLTNYAFGEQVHVFHREIDGAKLEYRITLPKDTFFIYQPISVELWVKNISRKSISVEKISSYRNPTWDNHSWIIKDSTGKNYPSNFWACHAYMAPAPTLKRGDSVGGKMGFSSNGIYDDKQLYPYQFFPTGTYSAKYPVDSIPFVFTVIEPSGQEAEALKFFLQAYYPQRWDTLFFLSSSEERGKLRIQAARNLVEMADSCPNSIYSCLALNDATNTLSFDERYPLIQRVLEECPEFAVDALSNLEYFYGEGKKDLAGFEAELKRIIKKNTDPKLTAAVKKALKEAKERFKYHKWYR